MIPSDRTWLLIARALTSEASNEEVHELSALLEGNDSLQQQYELLNRVWKQREHTKDDGENAEQTILHIIDKAAIETDFASMERNSRRRRRRGFLTAGSLFGVVLAIAWFVKTGKPAANNESAKQESLVAKKGSRTRSLLPDGTTVWLNVGSKLSYENDFTGPTREVKLEGEAFFDVVKNAAKPFIVHTGGIDIKVLGTAFNVKSYPEDKTVETTLYRGAVKVFRQQDSEKSAINLTPNQKLIIAKQAALETAKLSEDIRPSDVDLQPAQFIIAHIDSTKKESERFETAWVYSRLEFRGDSFDELARKLERWYNVEIGFTDEKVKQLNFNGSFEKETVEQAFMYLKETIPLFTYKIDNHKIMIGSAE